MMSENIPTEEDWGNWRSDIDQSHAYEIFFRKSNGEMQQDFYRCVIERADELRFMPEKPFQYYMLGFRDFIMKGDFQLFEAADAASCFLSLVRYKLEKQKSHIMPIIGEILPAITYVSNNQSEYDASESSYGSFIETYENIKKLIPG